MCAAPFIGRLLAFGRLMGDCRTLSKSCCIHLPPSCFAVSLVLIQVKSRRKDRPEKDSWCERAALCLGESWKMGLSWSDSWYLVWRFKSYVCGGCVV